MEIGILTYYGVHNHGAVLQACGLKIVLENMGHNIHILTFERDYQYISSELKKKYEISFKSIPFYFKYLIQKGAESIIYNYKKRCTLKSFRSSHFDLSQRYDSFQGDAVVIGSDEVFSLEIGVNPMMFGYGLCTKKILAYAGSFGPSTIEDIKSKGKEDFIINGFKKIDAISVRDCNSQKIIWTLCALEPPVVCDPVILYGYEKEMNEFIPDEKDYMVVYAYDNRMNDFEETSKIMAFARKNGLKVFSVGYYHKWCDKNINVSPFELLGWIKRAKLVVTDTFHGSVLSIICNTPMIVKLHGNANKLAFLLNEYGLSERITETFDDLDIIDKNAIDFCRVNRILAEKRNDSINFLRKNLEESNDLN